MPKLADFLLEIGKVRSLSVVPFEPEVTYDDRHVFVGTGRRGGPSLCLNNKAYEAPGPDGKPASCASVVHLLSRWPDDVLVGFSPWAKRPLSPVAALDKVVLAVEDASPDSVFGIFLTLAKLYGVDPAEIPTAWIDAVHEWEIDGNCQTPQSSWCALQSALAHAHFTVGQPATAEDYAVAWPEALRFLVACLTRGLDPEGIIGLRDVPEFNQAQSALNNDEQIYHGWLAHAHIIQLSLPMKSGEPRRLVVDGLMFVEDIEAGAAKSFYRNDRKNSPLGRGFAFAAHYRPGANPGNRFTITVDPRTGTQLTDLWYELERREDLAWEEAGEKRPADVPRCDISIGEKKYNQPWYITPNRTLIASPNELSKGGEFGTRLSWEDVCAAILAVFDPLGSVEVTTTPDGKPIEIRKLPPVADQIETEEFSPADKQARTKRLFIAHWPRAKQKNRAVSARGLQLEPAVFRSIAAHINHVGPRPLSLSDFPATKTWIDVQLSGGFAVITSNGLFVLDDWREQQLDVSAIRTTFVHAATLDGELITMNEKRIMKRGELVSLVDRVKRALEGERHDLERLQREAGIIRAKLARMRGELALPPVDADARLVRQELDRFWGLESRLEAADKEVAALESALKTLVEMQTARITRAIGLYGFPFFVATSVASPLAKFIHDLTNPVKASETDPSSVMVLGLIVACGFALASLLKLLIHFQNPLRKKVKRNR